MGKHDREKEENGKVPPDKPLPKEPKDTGGRHEKNGKK